jgi:signal transduction histidine kinase
MEELRITVIDNGVGMCSESSAPGRGLGLIGMRERIQALNGKFSYDTAPGEGFRIFIHIPHNSDLSATKVNT